MIIVSLFPARKFDMKNMTTLFNQTGIFLPPKILLVVFLVALGAGTVGAQTVTFEPLINSKNIDSLVEAEGLVFGGLDEGGLVYWPASDLSAPTRVEAGNDLSGNQVTDLAYSGLNVWVATADGGVTRIGNLSGTLEFRQYSSNLSDLDCTAVAGQILGTSEWVYYGTSGAGLGRIIDGLPGNIYTAEQDGLISNFINALQFVGDELFVATSDGVSRFSNNIFTTVNTGLTNTHINDLEVDANGNLLAGGRGGVFMWDADTETWSGYGGIGGWVNELSVGPSGTFALGISGTRSILSQHDGSTWGGVPLPYDRCDAVFSGATLLVGGREKPDGMGGAIGFGWVGSREGNNEFETWQLESSLVRNANGVTFGADGSPWIGSHNADAISSLQEDAWFHIYEIASAENDSSGLFDHSGNVLGMTTGTDGVVYAGQISRGVVRYDPIAERSNLMYHGSCGLNGTGVVNLSTHPAGPIFVMNDDRDEEKVEVLTDPFAWRNPDNWLVVPNGEDGLGNGDVVWEAMAESNDVVWFAVGGIGLVRWDINGDLLGPDDELTWHDFSDDRWDDPITSFPGAPNDPTAAVALALADDGSIWVGGNGVVRFTYDKYTRTATVEEYFIEKTSPFAEGLINANVEDLCVDGNGDLWVATRSGLNRGVTDGSDTSFEAWFDLGNYLANSVYGTLYSSSAIVGLPGGLYRKVACDPAGEKILLSSDRGAVLITPSETGSGGQTSAIDAAYFYPSPYRPDEGLGMLKLGGIDADALNGEAAHVQIFNLEGQLVYENESVSAGVGFWNGRNISIERNAVTTGMYLVRVSYGNQTAIKSLAIVR